MKIKVFNLIQIILLICINIQITTNNKVPERNTLMSVKTLEAFLAIINER